VSQLVSVAASPLRLERSYRTRPAARQDLAALVALEDECFVGCYLEHRFSAAQFNAYLQNARAVCLVITDSLSVIGYVSGQVRPARGDTFARIDSFAVSPAKRRRGLGSWLLRSFLKEARHRGSRAVSLEVAVANRQALRLFFWHGFRVVHQLPRYYSPTHDALRMRLDLPPLNYLPRSSSARLLRRDQNRRS
jgi:[ribosomal protein S18]-alanine N-acetyltransferase